VKNGFVFTGLIFGHGWRDPQLVSRVAEAALAFCLISGATYVVNDYADRESDRRHPFRKKRPLASGAVSVEAAFAVAALAAAGGFALGWNASPAVALILGIYALISLGYSFGLKNVIILDVFLIASGFLLRILAGTWGVGIPPSRWLILCGIMVTLFLGFAKRRAQLNFRLAEDPDSAAAREHYDAPLLDTMMSVTAAAVIITYSLYTMSPETHEAHNTQDLIYTVPLITYGIFRYMYLLLGSSEGHDPARELLRDPHLVITGLAWLVLTLILIR
jgi:4-hydroxybenzoate polyprenyltransferase